MAVLGAFSAATQIGAKDKRLRAVLCLAENSVDSIAMRPDDVITMLSGKTCEVNNTDAEGRLVLADGCHYAADVLKADVIVDMATLTGAQVWSAGLIVRRRGEREGQGKRAGAEGSCECCRERELNVYEWR